MVCTQLNAFKKFTVILQNEIIVLMLAIKNSTQLHSHNDHLFSAVRILYEVSLWMGSWYKVLHQLQKAHVGKESKVDGVNKW